MKSAFARPSVSSLAGSAGRLVLLLLSATAGAAGPGENLPGPGTTWSLAAMGDIIMNRRIALHENGDDPRFKEMVGIIRGADASFGNLEQSIFRLNEFQGWPEVENGGNWETAAPEILDDLKAMGFDLLSRANNHTTDYGVAGMRLTNEALDRLGFIHAGTGETLGRASRPGYLETPKGRIALISLASSFTPMSRAGEARDDMAGRPGLNPLRITRSFEADPATMQSLRAFAGSAGLKVPAAPDEPLVLLGSTIRPGPSVRAVDTMDPRDVERILREVRNAADQADYVVVTIHAHQHQTAEFEWVTPPWLVEIAHRCIEAGASAFIGHGPHTLRGMEIHRGRPIFYSLANFVFQNETIDPMPSDHYEAYGLPPTALASDLYNARFHNGTAGFPTRPEIYESVIAVPVFRGREAVEVRLYPIDLARTAPRSQRGTPRLAEEAHARHIIDRMIKMSAVLGTTLTYENGVGVWRAQP
jgi:poly-gamma-glutamate capsule biosynthesis protein CapA/YwtB (metallophosphatase superfamily)